MSPPGLVGGGFSLVCAVVPLLPIFPSAFVLRHRSLASVGADAVDEALDQRRGLLFAPDEMDIAGVQAGYRFGMETPSRGGHACNEALRYAGEAETGLDAGEEARVGPRFPGLHAAGYRLRQPAVDLAAVVASVAEHIEFEAGEVLGRGAGRSAGVTRNRRSWKARRLASNGCSMGPSVTIRSSSPSISRRSSSSECSGRMCSSTPGDSRR